jgi:tRNA A37 threonylcarbamoyladenosine dehydratase
VINIDQGDAFAAVSRVFGNAGLQRLQQAHICVVGLGGVGSWAVEALARTGVGALTLIDHDDIAQSNINRQVHADQNTIGNSKVDRMTERVKSINPNCECTAIDDMLVTNNLQRYIDNTYDYVIDAIDSIKFKSALIYHCKRNRIPVITTGGAGGLTDPTQISISDLSRTWNDPLAATVRKRLRTDYGWTTNPKRRFGVECVFSKQQPVYPRADGSVGHEKPGVPGANLDCEFGYGSLVGVTAVFGMIAASRVMEKLCR